METNLLVINCGSSSLKLALFDGQQHKKASALAERLGDERSIARIQGDDFTLPLPPHSSHKEALDVIISAFKDRGLMGSLPVAIGHRVVHGGETFQSATLIDNDVIAAIDQCSSLAPLHNSINLSGIQATRQLFPEVPQVAVFDTAFHHTLPARAYRYALPEQYYQDWGVRRYGFHGTSHAYMASEASARLGRSPEATSIISAHLGNGCSVSAIRNGLSVDTSMGLTPLEGLVMGTRSGDVDPGLFDFLAAKGLPAGEVSRVLNNESGLLGLSEKTNDMRALCQLADEGHPQSALAIEVFCFRLAKYVGAMMASLDRLDALVFTGGIGENSSRVREQTLNHLGLMGFELNAERNATHGQLNSGRIDSDTSRFPILVISTNEELVIAREALRLAHSSTKA